VTSEFDTRVKQVITGLMELSFNAELYWKNNDLRGTVCVIPTSAVTGEGACFTRRGEWLCP
jgi:translation initiation factor IF-2